MLPQRSLASSSICSVLFRSAYKLLCFWMRRERIEIFHRSPLRENSGSMTTKRSSRSPRELKFVWYVSGEISEKLFKWRAYVVFGGVPIRLSWPTTSPSQRKALLERYPRSQSKELFAFASTRTESHETKLILRCNNLANELWLPRRWNQWKHWAKCQRLGAKCDRLLIF